jgi:cysteine dioxygenase
MIEPSCSLSLSEFLSNLETSTTAEYVVNMRKVKLTDQELEEFATFSKEGYTRHCFVNNERYEVLLLCWEKDQQTPIHSHGGQECWVKVLRGQIEEVHYKKVKEGLCKETKRSIREPEDISYMNDKIGLHTLGSVGHQRAISLHLYAAPIESCDIYDDQGRLLEEKEMAYDSVGV